MEISKENYDVAGILEKMRDYDNLLYYIDLYKNEANAKRQELNLLKQEITNSRRIVNSYRIKLELINDLERMGFGINGLRILYNTLMEIGYENNIRNKTFGKIEKEFFDDLKNYGEVLSSRNEIERLQKEIKHLEIQIIKEKERYNSCPKVIDSLERLSNVGISENDIIAIDRIISMSGTIHQLNKDKAKPIQNIMSDLQRYGSLKLTIKNLQ